MDCWTAWTVTTYDPDEKGGTPLTSLYMVVIVDCTYYRPRQSAQSTQSNTYDNGYRMYNI